MGHGGAVSGCEQDENPKGLISMTRHATRTTQYAARIGAFDSGVGGLSVVREIVRQLPAHPIVYLADQVHAPYGQRPLAEIRALAEGITRFLLAQGAQVVVIACNTASAAALYPLRAKFPAVPFVGMEPAVKPAAERSRSGHIGVIATATTFQGELFASLLNRFAGDVTVHTQVCPELVPLVEAGELNSERTRSILRGYLSPLLAADIDKLVLGCTHYPFLQPLIEEITGPGVEVIDPAPAVARQTGRVLAEHESVQPVGPGVDRAQHAPHRFYTTGDPARFQAALLNLLGLNHPVEAAVWDVRRCLRMAQKTGNPNYIPNLFGI
jgi:glutamate racemase